MQPAWSAEQCVDVVGADPDLLVVVRAQLDVVEHVEVALGWPFSSSQISGR
jgi:hypothetical protein